MSNILIVTAPVDPPLRYGYFWLKRTAYILAEHDHRVVILRNANLESFANALMKHDPRMVIMNGHGGSKAIMCNNQVLLGVYSYDPELGKKIVRENPHWMRGRIVFLFTCNTGKELAPRLAEEGALAVAAWKRDYIFVSEDSSPSRDERAYPFFAAPIQLPLLLAEGGTFREGVHAVRDAFLYYIEEAEARGDTVQAKYLLYDLENFITYGDARL